MAQQMPDIPQYDGSKEEGAETIDDWIDRLEIIADAFEWDEQTKIAHLTSRLRGAALAFYRLCTPSQKRSYDSLKEALLRRFTTVHVRSVQGSLFHKRTQKQQESVDEYLQELKVLFRRAYPKLARDQEEEGESMLTLKFVAGLRSELQERMTTTDGTLEEVLVKARFEEARCRELKTSQDRRTGHQPNKETKRGDTRPPPRRNPDGNNTCYKCGATGHYARECPLAGRSQPRENSGAGSRGKTNGVNNSRVRGSKIRDVVGTLKTLNSASGPQLKFTVQLEGHSTEALVDTGSPATIVSLRHLLQLWKWNWAPTDAKWLERAEEAVQDPSTHLQTYDGTDVHLLGEAKVTLKVNDREVEVMALIQEEAPQDLLIGTDCLTKLGSNLSIAGEVLTMGPATGIG